VDNLISRFESFLRGTVAKRTQHVAPNNVAICCVGMLRSFRRGFKGTVKAPSENLMRVLQPLVKHTPEKAG